MYPSLLLDRTSLVHSSDHCVLVLQTDQPSLAIPFYADASGWPSQQQPLAISTRATTPHALSGLASSLGSLVSPFESFAADGLPTVDFHWSIGHHPFGPFASAVELPDAMVDAARRHIILQCLTRANDLFHDSVAAVESLVARYVHPSEEDSPTHREQTALQQDQTSAGGYERALGHLSEEAAGGARHAVRDDALGLGAVGRVGEGSSGRVRGVAAALLADGGAADEPLRRPAVGALLQRLRDGTLTLSSELAATQSVRMHDALLAHLPTLAAAVDSLAAADLDSAHSRAAELLAAASAAAAATVDEVKGLEAALKCCRLESARPRSYHLKSVGMLALVGFAVWCVVLCLTAPSDRRGKTLPTSMRPAHLATWGARFGLGGRAGGYAARKQY